MLFIWYANFLRMLVSVADYRSANIATILDSNDCPNKVVSVFCSVGLYRKLHYSHCFL